MSDLISREAAIKAVNDALRSWSYMVEWRDNEIRKAIKEVPSAQPERKKGKWIHDGEDIPHGVDWMHCSVCGRRDPHVPAAMTNFCPNCGAEMEDEKRGEA